MVSLHRGRFVVVQLYSTFSVIPPGFFFRGKFLSKITIFLDLGGCEPTFLSHNGELWHEGAHLGLPPSSQIL